MTPRKAIEVAVDITPQDVSERNPEGTWGSWLATKQVMVAERAYHLGLAAGLMEGARMAMRDGGWTPTIGEIQKRGRAMTKKIRKQAGAAGRA